MTAGEHLGVGSQKRGQLCHGPRFLLVSSAVVSRRNGRGTLDFQWAHFNSLALSALPALQESKARANPATPGKWMMACELRKSAPGEVSPRPYPNRLQATAWIA